VLYSTWRKAYGLFGGLSSLSAVQHLAKGLMAFLAGFGQKPHEAGLTAACNPRLAFAGNLKKSGHAAGRGVCSAPLQA